LPATVGIGFLSSAGGLVDFRHRPESGGTNTGLTVFAMPVMAGLQLTERLSVGAGASIGIAVYDGPFIGIGGLTTSYALRGTAGANFQATERTTIGAYFQTKQSFQFDNAILLPAGGGTALDVDMELPQNIGIGIANQRLLDGRLLVGVDVLYKFWDQADLFRAIYDNQLAVQFGTQLTTGRFRWRAGYVWADNPLNSNPGPDLGGVIQDGGLPVVRYSQGLLAITSQHRLTFGVGVVDLLPGVDLDLMGGGMFRDDEQLGPFTETSSESYWVGFGLTWRFARGGLAAIAPDRW
jgi:long-chain fatty acid transport protein